MRKYFVIFLFAVFGIFTLMILSFNDAYYLAYGMLDPLFPEELLEQSEIIFVGNITSKNVLQVEYSDKVMTTNNGSLKIVMQNFTNNVNEYTVKIEEFLKAPQDFYTVTVREPTAGENFEVGDRVILYIPKLDEPNKYRFESFSLPESCDSQDALRQQRLWFTGREFTIMQNDIKFDGYKKKQFQNLMTNELIRFAYAHDMQTMHGKRFDLEIEAFREDFDGFDYEQPVFNQTITAESKPCKWIASAEWEFIPTQDGVYRIIGYAKTTGDEPSSDEMLFDTPIHVVSTNVFDLPPLKQIKSGVPSDEIQCKDNLELIQKYDGSPVCVKSETVPKLMQRGGILSEFKPTSATLDLEFKSQLTVEGLNQTYNVGEKIEFTVKFDGIWHGCGVPGLRIEDAYHQPVWEGNLVTSICNPDMKKDHIKKEWVVNDDSNLGVPVIDNEGFYTLFVTFADSTILNKIIISENPNIAEQTNSRPIFSNEIIIPKGTSNSENKINVFPQTLTIYLKDNHSVIWSNLDDVSSTFVADDQSWTTGIIKPGESISTGFNHPGVFNFHGSPHPWQKGTIIVK